MNYLNYKKQFPKSINLFFDWVSNQYPNEQNLCVDNVYFLAFFCNFFYYYQDICNSFLIDNKKDYFDKLKEELVERSLDENYNYYFEKHRIIFGVYSDTKTEFIRIIIKNEDSFESAFFVLEILIENAYYV